MVYDIVILAVGVTAAVGAILAAADISRQRVYFVGLVRPDSKDHKPVKERQTFSETPVKPIRSEEILESAKSELTLSTLEFGKFTQIDFGIKPREVVRCRHCQLVQFRTASDLCGRCGNLLPEPRLASKSQKIQAETVESIPQQNAAQAEINEQHRRLLHDLDRRMRQIEEKQLDEKSSQEWEESAQRRSTTAASPTVH